MEEANQQTEKLLGQEKKPIQEDTFFDKYIAGEKTKGMFNPTAKDVVDTATDFIPGVSETKDIISLGSNIGKGDYVGAGIDATSLVLGAVPIAGDVARQAFRKLAKNFVKTKKTDINVSTQDALKQTDQDIENWKAKNQTSPEFQKRLKGRNETLQGMAQGLEDKVVTKKEYREAVDAIRPIRTVKEVPKPATFKDTVSALDSRQRKNPIVGVNYNIPEGDRISARLDITAYTQYDTWIPTLKHEGKTMYKPSVVLKDVTFIKPDSPQVGKALKVATGKPKSPFAVMEGNYVDADNDSTYKYAKKIFKDDDVIQVGYDPTRRGYFYDRRTGNPVLEADEVVQVGHLVLAKKAKLGNADDFFYSKGGDIVDKDVEKAAKPKMRPSNQMELFTYLKDNPDVKGMKEIELDRMRGIITDDDPRAPINTEGLKADIVRQRVLEREELLRDIDRYREGRKELAKGGSMPKQMELFSEGGLKDEGGTVDPVSGNDVPPGSTQEEVRDDIPARLSEGEFVFPADVVRYIGLEKLMMMRQEAKAGLKRMEEMGQMGNADEATLPDDIPFTIDDLDMDDDTIEANIGTFVPPRVPTATPYNPNVNPYTPTGVVPTTYAPYKPATGTSLLGASTQGAPETENRRYVNKTTGQVRMIPFNKATGQSLYPIPEGFVAEAETVKEPPKQKTAKVQTAKVQTQQDGGDSDDDVGTLGGARMDVGGREFAVGYNLDGSVTLTDPKTMEKQTYNKDSQIAKDVKAVTAGQIVDIAKMTPAGVTTAVVQAGLEKIGVTLPGTTKVSDIKKAQKEAKKRLSETPSGVGTDPTTGMTLDDMKSIQAGLEGKDVDKAEMQRLADKVSDIVDDEGYNLNTIGSDSSSLGGTSASYSTPSAVASASSFGDSDDPSDSSPSGGDPTAGLDDFKQGGLAKRKTKVKKMKRGGLASR